MPAQTDSRRLPETIAPENANSTKIAVSVMREQLLLTIVTLSPELSRTALKAQSEMRLLATVTLPPRKILMPLPFWPSPPSLAATRSMRLPITNVPSSRRSDVQT
jgi:hypothetical protein